MRTLSVLLLMAFLCLGLNAHTPQDVKTQTHQDSSSTEKRDVAKKAAPNECPLPNARPSHKATPNVLPVNI